MNVIKSSRAINLVYVGRKTDVSVIRTNCVSVFRVSVNDTPKPSGYSHGNFYKNKGLAFVELSVHFNSIHCCLPIAVSL
jgi:hypothetical protein